MKRRDLAVLLAGGLVAPSILRAQSAGFTSLLNGRDAEGWTALGNANWRIENGMLVADRGTGFMVTANSYADFELRIEVFLEAKTNSGIFIRMSDRNVINSNNSYEVNLWDQRPEQRYGTGAIVDIAVVDPMPRAGDRWNTLEITARGDRMSVVLNGQRTVNEVQHARHRSGPFALQHAPGVNNDDTGVVRFRRVDIRTL
jgi:hypothetical protein